MAAPVDPAAIASVATSPSRHMRPLSVDATATNPFSTPNQSTPSIPLEELTAHRGETVTERNMHVDHSPSQNATAASSTWSENATDPNLDVDLSAPENASSLPKPDGGRAAWLFLVGATAIEVLIWGIPFSIGILHAYWTDELFRGRGASTITLASTLQTGLLYMVAALSGPVFAAYGQWRAWLQGIALFIGSMSIIGAGFATEPWHLLVTIGIFYPAFGVTYLPCSTLLFEWFYVRRGLASGIMFAGTGVGGALFPFIVSGLLNRFGYKATMVTLGLSFLILGGISLLPVKRRIPYVSGSVRRRGRWVGQSKFLRSRAMVVGALTILLIGLGNFIPSLWIPTFANDMKMTRPGGTGLIAIMNAASVPGNALLGHLTDRWPVSIAVFSSSLATALSCLFFWGFGTHDGTLVTFAILYGLLGLSFSALWVRMIGVIARMSPLPTARVVLIIFPIFAFLRGVGNISSGPISDALLKLDTLRGGAGAYGFRNYGILIMFTGVSIFSGGLMGLFLREKR